LTFGHSTSGRINLNALIFPDNLNFSLTQTGSNPIRDEPIKALLRHSLIPSVANPSAAPRQLADSDVDALFESLIEYLQSKPSGVLDYPGEICEVPGFADATAGAFEWERETLIRNLGGLVTTRSNTFSVWGVAQSVIKKPRASNPGVFEPGDTIVGEKRFRAIVERHVWPGVDEQPGNGDTGGGTAYLATSLGADPFLGSATNQVDAIDPQSPLFSRAYHPGAAEMRYRVVYFEYLNK
jgi:hypothetical protein